MLCRIFMFALCSALSFLHAADSQVYLSVNGIEPSFILIPVAAGKGYLINITLKNGSSMDRDIPIYAEFIQHIVPVDSSGSRVPLREGAPILEAPAETVHVPAGDTIIIEKHLDLQRFYDLDKVRSLSVWYDLRLLGVDPKTVVEWRSPWVSIFLQLPE